MRAEVSSKQRNEMVVLFVYKLIYPVVNSLLKSYQHIATMNKDEPKYGITYNDVHAKWEQVMKEKCLIEEYMLSLAGAQTVEELLKEGYIPEECRKYYRELELIIGAPFKATPKFNIKAYGMMMRYINYAIGMQLMEQGV